MAGIKGKGGQKGRSGRKTRAEELGLPRMLTECWKQSQRREVIEALHLAALTGSVPAAALLMAYAYGKPTEKIEATITHREFEIEIGGDAIATDSEPQFVN